MKALVYHGPGRKSWQEIPDARVLDPTDAIVRISTATICGTDLHILRGDVPAVTEGRVLGHEAVGIVEEVGAVTTLRPGTRVLISCITSCGRCTYCRNRMYGQCLGGGGWILGHKIDGVQAELARVPFADTSTYPLPDAVDDETAVMLADILPTSYEVGAINGAVRPGDTVVIVGAGPIGLAATKTCRLFSPRRIVVVDIADARLDAAKQFGADNVVNSRTADVVATVRSMTDGMGAHVVLEAVGVPETFELCTRLVRPGGHIANIGVHGRPATLHLEDLWIRNVTLTTGLVDTWSTPTLLDLVAGGQLDTRQFLTHHFDLDNILQAYEVFGDAASSGALKVALTA